MKAVTRCRIELPGGFRRNDVLAFHRRDAQQISERIDGNVLNKAVMWNGVPACLTLRFGERVALAELAMDDQAEQDVRQQLRGAVRHMLGLTQPIEVFEQAFRRHRQIGVLIRRNGGLRVPQTATPWEALCWAITGQQISVSAAVSIRRKFIQNAGVRHSAGLWCFPDAARVADVPMNRMRKAGFSQTKANTLIELARAVADGTLPLDAWRDQPDEQHIRERLQAIRGIGPWTVSYALLRGFAWLDGSLHGDVAVRRNLQRLLQREDKLGEKEAAQWLQPFSPWRALVAAHLWAMNKIEGY
jgi:DNA-3-methyladenine glycosylase II